MQDNINIKDVYDIIPAENTHSEGVNVIEQPLRLKLQALEAALKEAKTVICLLLPKSLHYQKLISSLY